MRYVKPCIDLAGQRFERLLVIEKAEKTDYKTRWVCLCECGRKTIVVRSNLISGATKSCGCLRSEASSERAKRTRPVDHKVVHTTSTFQKKKPSVFDGKFGRVKRRAKDKCIEFSITISDFESIVTQPCHYCGVESSMELKRKSLAAKQVNGIDRKDNAKGYEISNCLPCCPFCNFMKKDRGYEEFVAQVKLISSRFK